MLADDLQCYGTAQIDIERLVSDPHRAATQLDRFPVFTRHQFEVLIPLHRLFRCRLDRFLERRHAGLRRAWKSLAKHAYRTEFHCFRKLVTATRTGTSTLVV